jgi:hypothetical protein
MRHLHVGPICKWMEKGQIFSQSFAEESKEKKGNTILKSGPSSLYI